MSTECIASKLEFQGLDGRRVEAEFNGGQITSDAGGLLLREVESRYGFIRGLAACFGDRRDPRFTEFSVEELVGQRIYGLALGYEDVNDQVVLKFELQLARFLYGPRFLALGSTASRRATMSSTSQTWSVRPASIAGVTRRVL